MGKVNELTFLQRRSTDSQISSHLGNAIETTLSYHFIPTRIIIITKTDINNCLLGCGDIETLKICW